jgi:hypothetical protein
MDVVERASGRVLDKAYKEMVEGTNLSYWKCPAACASNAFSKKDNSRVSQRVGAGVSGVIWTHAFY